MTRATTGPDSPYRRVFALVRLIPPGQVATYGQLARLAGCTARQAGYAMAAAPADIPWHRVVNAKGGISPRRHGDGADWQRLRLEAEGFAFLADGRIDLRRHAWAGPPNRP